MDPTNWEIDPTGVHYRRATRNEITKNQWHEDVLLVALQPTIVNAVKNGSTSTTVNIPLADPPGWPQEDLPILTVGLVLRGSTNASTFTEKRQNSNGTVTITRLRPTYRYYQQQGLDWNNFPDHAVHVFSSSRGGVVLEGASVDRSFWFDGPYSRTKGVITIDILPASGRSVFVMSSVLEQPVFVSPGDGGPQLGAGSTAEIGGAGLPLATEVEPQLAGYQCGDGYDNDVLDGHDGCDFACIAHPDFAGVEFPAPRLYEYAKTFAMFGDAEWCTQHEGDWDVVLWSIGQSAAQMLNWVEAPGSFGGSRVPPMVIVGKMCWPFKTLTAAQDCHWNSVCGGMGDYPFKGVDNFWGAADDEPSDLSFMNRVWGAKNIPNSPNVPGAVDAWAAANTGANINQIHPVHLAAVVTDITDVEDGLGPTFKGGVTFFPAFTWRAGAVVVLGNEFLVPGDENFEAAVGTVGRRVAHEFGHQLGLEHDDTSISSGGFTLDSFMHNPNGGSAPILGDDVLSEIEDKTQYQAWTTFAPDKWVPRPSGFGYRGCINNASCPAGLTCTLYDDGAKVCR